MTNEELPPSAQRILDLIPAELRNEIPRLCATENVPDPLVYAKLFTPWSNWAWYITEFDGDDRCFGLVHGFEAELGYFSLKELAELAGHGGLRIERDAEFTPRTLSQIQKGPSNHQGVTDRSSVFYAAFTAEAGRPYPSPWETPAVRMLETALSSYRPDPNAPQVNTPRQAAEIFHAMFGDADREHFAALYLNARHKVSHAHVVSVGTLSSSLVHPREVFKGAVLANATSMIIGHNHPSGEVDPSEEDKALFERLQSSGEVMGITVLDSVIVGPAGRFYAAKQGQIQTLGL